MIVADAATVLGLVPLAFLAIRQGRGRVVDRAYWWLATSLGISFVADVAGIRYDQWVVTYLYVITQSALIGAVFLLEPLDKLLYLVALCVVGVLSAIIVQHDGRDVLLHTIGWGSATYIVWQQKALGPLRVSLLVYFGVGLAVFLPIVAVPGWPTWIAYQLTRAAGIALFCRAVTVRHLSLRPA